MIKLHIYGIAGERSLTVNSNEWANTAPVRRVLMIHDACRDITKGQPFDIKVMSND